MANEVDDIVTNVVLTGNEDVERAFDKIREAGERAFDGIDKAMEHSIGSFTGIAAAATAAVASLAIVSVAVFEFVKSTEEGISSLSDLADQTGTTTKEMSGLKAAFANGGVGAGQLEQAFRRLSVTIQESWTEIQHASRESSDSLRSNLLSVSNASEAAADAQRKLANISRDQSLQERANVNSVRDARLRLRELQGEDVSAERESLQIKQAKLTLAEAQKKRDDDAANAESERIKATNDAEQKLLSLSQARRKEDDDRKNDINNITSAVQRIAAGDKNAIEGINGTAENISKGIIASAGAAGKALGQLRGDITDLASPGPAVRQVFEQIGKTLANIDDPALKTAVSFRLLGRTVSQDFLNVLTSGKIDEFIERTNRLGLAVDEVDKEVSEKFRQSLFTLQNDIGLVSNKLATAFGPGVTQVLTSLDAALLRNKNSIIAFAEDIGTRAVPIVNSFIRVLEGVPDAAQDQWLVDYTDKIKAFGSGIGSIVTLITKLVTGIIDLAGGVGNVINSILGTNLNAFDVILGAWVLRATLHFGAVRAAAIYAATGVATSITAALAPLAFFAAATYALVKAWQAVSDIFSLQGQTSHWDAILEGTLERLKAIGDMLTGNVTEGFKRWKEANEKQAEAEKALDDNDKKTADAQKSRQQEVAKVARDTENEKIEAHKKSHSEIDAHSKASTDNQISDLHRLSEENKRHVDESKANLAELNKVQNTVPPPTVKQNKDGSVTDENGIKVFRGNESDTRGITPSMAADLANKIAKQVGGEVAVNGNNLAQGRSIEGFDRSFPVSHPTNLPKVTVDDTLKTTPEDIQKALEKLREFNGGMDALAEKAPKAAAILRSLSDRSDGSIAGQRPDSVQSLDRMLQNQKQITEFEELVHQQLNQFIHAQGGQRSGSDNYKPPVLGRYDPETQDFIPNKVQNNPSAPAGNPQPLPFPTYEKFLRDTLPQNIPLPKSRPEDLLPQDQTNTPAGMSEAVKQGVIEGLATSQTQGDVQQSSGQSDQQSLDQLQSSGDQLSTGFDNTSQSAQTLGSALDDLTIAAQNAAVAQDGAGGRTANDGSVSVATGGYIRGPGGPKGDKIAAWLSDKEYVHKSEATEFYGLDFMNAINNLQMPRFAMGGLVGLMSPRTPRFRDGGVVNTGGDPAMSHLGTIDLTTDHGVVRVAVDRGGLGQLRKAAVMRNIGSDRKPSWVR